MTQKEREAQAGIVPYERGGHGHGFVRVGGRPPGGGTFTGKGSSEPSKDPGLLQHITFTADVEKAQSFTALCDTGQFTITSGYTKVNIVDVPQRVGISVFAGFDPVVATIPLIFNQWGIATDGEVEAAINTLEWMASRGAGVAGEEPSATAQELPVAVWIIANDLEGNPSNLIPHAYRRVKWIITGLAWGESIRDKKGNRQRQRVTVTVTEKHDPGPYNATKSHNKTQKKRGWHMHKVKGDKDNDCMRLATNVCRTSHDKVRDVAREIQSYNNNKHTVKLRTVTTKIKANTEVWIPSG